jgi:RasGEF domain/RasGEF N-terminal motif
MQIFVKSFDGRSRVVQLSDDDDFKCLQRAVSECCGVPAHLQLLCADGKLLCAENVHHLLGDGQTLHVSVPLLGAGIPKPRELSPIERIVFTKESTLRLLTRISDAAKSAAIALKEMLEAVELASAGGGTMNEAFALAKLKAEHSVFIVVLNSHALLKKVGTPSRKEREQGIVSPPERVVLASAKLEEALAIFRMQARQATSVKTQRSRDDLIVASVGLADALCSLRARVAVALSDPVVMSVQDEMRGGGAVAASSGGAASSSGSGSSKPKVNVSVRPVLSYGQAYGLEKAKDSKETSMEFMWSVAKRVAADLKEVLAVHKSKDLSAIERSLGGRRRTVLRLVDVVRTHAHGRLDADDKQKILAQAADVRAAAAKLFAIEEAVVASLRDGGKGLGSTAIKQLNSEAGAFARQLAQLLSIIVAVREHEAKTRKRKDVSLWEELEQEGKNIVFDDTAQAGRRTRGIRAATLNQLILRLTNPKIPDLALQKAFLTTYQSFCKPSMLLTKLIERYHVPRSQESRRRNMTMAEWNQKVVKPIQLRVYNILKLWLDARFGDFDHILLARLNLFVEVLKRDGNEKLAKQLINRMKRQLAQLEKARAALRAEKKLPRVPNPDQVLFELPEEVFAQQLTIRFFEIYRAIEPVELLRLAWSNAKLKHRAPNVLNMINLFNALSSWTKTRLLSCPGLRQRGRFYAKIVRTAQLLYEYHNFDTLLNLISVTNHSTVKRLKFTREAVPSKLAQAFEDIKEQVSSDKNSKNYRDLVHRSAPPILPYLGVYLTDLTFIEEGNPDFSNGGLINFRKREFAYGVITEIQQYQLDAFPFRPDPNIQAAWDSITYIDDDDALFKLSLIVEPRNKDRSELKQDGDEFSHAANPRHSRRN